MKRILLFLSIVCFTFLSTSCPYRYCGAERPFGYDKRAIIYLHVLKEDGSAMNDLKAKEFKIDYSGRGYYEDVKTIINVDDHLIYELSSFDIFSSGNVPSEAEVKEAIDDKGWFILRDTTDTYKTVRKTYKETYKSYEKDPNSYSGRRSTYICHCEIKLERK